MDRTTTTPLSILTHPYQTLEPVTGGREQLRVCARSPGSALIWEVGEGAPSEIVRLAEGRPGGLALIVVLPDVRVLEEVPTLLAAVQRCRPHGFLPSYGGLVPQDLAAVLRRPPLDFPADATDYLAWRGIVAQPDTLKLVRRVFELSASVRTISRLSRNLYMSRRALGRRFAAAGLPVPSHWLQVARLLRLASRLQNSDASIFSIAYESGYPDGFSVSNQMYRLTGVRPSQVRERLGWEWMLEAWLRKEADEGGLAPGLRLRHSGPPKQPKTPIESGAPRRRSRRSVA